VSKPVLLSALVVAHDEERRLPACLERLTFVDEIVVVLDRCTDGSREVARRFTSRIVEGAWELEGDRRNTAIDRCRGQWIFEVDADEWITPELAAEIRHLISWTPYDVFDIPMLNHVGGRPVPGGWMAALAPDAKPSLFRKGHKSWGNQRVHPALQVTGRHGPMLEHPIIHHLANDISDLVRRFDRNTTLRARDLRDSGEAARQGAAGNLRKAFSRFWKCYVARGGRREGPVGMAVALLCALYPLVAYLKATLDEETAA
jgi:glycosyltransferase involved in cell wall biosynthesis